MFKNELYICQRCGRHFNHWLEIAEHPCRGIYLTNATLVYRLHPCEILDKPYYGICVELIAYLH